MIPNSFCPFSIENQMLVTSSFLFSCCGVNEGFFGHLLIGLFFECCLVGSEYARFAEESSFLRAATLDILIHFQNKIQNILIV